MLHTFSIPRSTTRLYCGSGQIVENDSLVMTRFAGGLLDGGGNARYYMTDYQGNNIAVIGSDGTVIDKMGYSGLKDWYGNEYFLDSLGRSDTTYIPERIKIGYKEIPSEKIRKHKR